MSSIRDQLSSYGKQHKRQGRIAATIDMSRVSNLSCGAKCLKYFVMGLAAFLVAVGIIILGVGASLANSTTAEVTGPGFTNAVIACGVFIAATGTLGLVGGKLESRLMLYGFALFMGIWFLILLILSSYAVSKQGKEFDIISRGWSGLSEGAKVSIQDSWVCCGAATYNDNFAGKPCPRYANDDNRPVEGSKRPCIPLIVPEFRAMWFTFGVCGIVLAVILLSGLITSCLLMSSINNANAELLKRRRAG